MSGYTPVFDSVFTGTLCGQYPDTAAWLFLLALSDRHGVVDVTPQYISSVTGMPVADLLGCIDRFMKADPGSRTPDNDGCRLELLHPHRPWGWRILNHGLYRERARLASKSAKEVAEGANKKRLMGRRFSEVGLTSQGDEFCRYCAEPATGVDHIAWDGPDEPWNAVPACQRCNTSKHRRSLMDFLNSCSWVKPDTVMSEPKLAVHVKYEDGRFDRRNSHLTAGNHNGPPSAAFDPLSDLNTNKDLNKNSEGNTTASATPASRALANVSRDTVDPEWFLDFKLAYPNRAGDQGWRKAMKAAKARMGERHHPNEFLAGATRYARYCEATGKIGTEFVKQAATFLGPDKPFLLSWELPASKADVRLNQNLSAAEEFMRRTEEAQ